jgi:MYXO-CTERM domain-containing protein
MGAMRKLLAWLGAATLFTLVSRAEANDVLKPYVVLILDTSGSMLVPTGAGPTSCGRSDNRLNHAVCAINNIVNSYGDMVFAFGRFRETTSGTYVDSCDANGNQEGNNPTAPTFPVPNGGDQCSTQGAYCGDCDPSTGEARSCMFCNATTPCPSGYACDTDRRSCFRSCTDSMQCMAGAQCVQTSTGGFCNNRCTTGDLCDQATARCVGPGTCTNSTNNFEVLTALVDGNNAASARFVNGNCNTCGVTASGMLDPEIWGVSRFTFTPLSGSLRGARQYWMGNQGENTVIWPATTDNLTNNPGYDPINRDPSAHVFIPANDAAGCSANPNTCSQFTPETGAQCNDALDNDGDGRVNDGCPANGAPETGDQCLNAIDDDGDGVVNDGCPAWCSGTNCCCGSQCRPYITILLTDGEETCTTFSNTVTATQELLATTPRSDSMLLASIQRTNNVVTVTTRNVDLPHPFKTGDEILISGVTGFNGTFRVTSTPALRTLTYAQSGANAGPIGDTGNVRHTASQYRYQIQTKPIGFGIPPGDPQIEAIAHAGGSPDVPGVHEGYYAQNAAELQLAISQILADSVRAELCNGRDDDCDTIIDEGFPNKGGQCTNGQLGVCTRTGTLVCRADGTGLECDAPTVPPGSEGTVCNGLDDDCDGRIDEGLNCGSCVPTGEICNNADEDCDGVADQSCRCSSNASNPGAVCNGNNAQCPGGSCVCTPLTRPCGVGVCGGIETCTAGNWGGCTAQPATEEECDGIDNDCDGICDGFQLECSEVNGACNPNVRGSCPGTLNPGHPDNNPIPENVCRPGVRTCPLNNACNGTNEFGFCSGEVLPCTGAGCDICDGLDNDCDNKIDEDFVPAACDDNCGLGMTSCVNGQIQCNATAATTDATCDNRDDDCDGKFDEDWVCPDLDNDGVCDVCSTGMVCMGVGKCVMGQVVCDGGPIGNEVCNCADDDCDDKIDEGTICPIGSECVSCQCAFRCAEGEFPCPLGKKCEGTAPDRFCVNDPCFNVTCPAVNGNVQTCIPNPDSPNEPQCVDTCSQITNCPTTFVCVGSLGECRPNNCTTFPDMCSGSEVCVAGTCVSNPCDGVTCDGGMYCVGGACVSSCADVSCPSGQRCRLGACETDPCGGPCPFGQACNDATGQCINDPCKTRTCFDGQWCNPNSGQCEGDLCVSNNITCPSSTDVCRGGTCVDADSLMPDGGNEAHVTVGGGGGCSTTGAGSAGLLALALGLLLVRRRRPRSVGGAL